LLAIVSFVLTNAWHLSAFLEAVLFTVQADFLGKIERWSTGFSAIALKTINPETISEQ